MAASGHPAAAERAVDLDESVVLGELRLHESELGDKQSRVAVQHLEVTGGAALITQVGKPARVLSGNDDGLLCLAQLAEAAITDQRVGDFSECLLDGLLIDELALGRGALRRGRPASVCGRH